VISALTYTTSRREHIQIVLSDPTSGTSGEDGQAWEIQRNVRAVSSREVMHKVTWTLENEAQWESDWDHQPSANDAGNWDMKGHGGGINFVSSLRDEDRIAIVANARVSLHFLQRVCSSNLIHFSFRAGRIMSHILRWNYSTQSNGFMSMTRRFSEVRTGFI